MLSLVRQEMENYRGACLAYVLERTRQKGETSAEDWKEALDSITKVNLLCCLHHRANVPVQRPADLKHPS